MDTNNSFTNSNIDDLNFKGSISKFDFPLIENTNQTKQGKSNSVKKLNKLPK